MAEEQINQEVEQNVTPQDVTAGETQDSGSFEDMFSNFEVTPNQAAFEEDTSFTSQEPASEPVDNPNHASSETKPDNEQVRYEYWQSQADKLRNELDARNEYIKNMQANAQIQQPQQTEEPKVEAASQEEYFPAPPPRPQKPRGFNREAAYTEPTSESAAYMDDLDEWRDQMGEYNRLHSQWQIAKVQEQNDAMRKEAEQAKMQREAQEQQNREVQQMISHVSEKYNMDQNESLEFVRTMSDPESISMDNLVELYRMRKGTAPAQQPINTPSKDFSQVQRAQSVPRPMGVTSGLNAQTEATKSPVDDIVDSMISSHKNATNF